MMQGVPTYCDVVLSVQSPELVPHPRFGLAKAVVVQRGQNAKRDSRELSRAPGEAAVWGMR